MIDLLFLSQNRLEFTRACLSNLIANTDWSAIHRLYLYDDNSSDGTREFVRSYDYGTLGPKVHFVFGSFGSPVAIMNHYLDKGPSEIFAKIDSDTMVPPLWLESCLKIMDASPGLSFLGIEAFRPVAAGMIDDRSFDQTVHIGGIGLMRASAFEQSRPFADGRQGFTQFQTANEQLLKGWINPALPVFLLDWIPREPWMSLTKEYVANGWNRDWPSMCPELCPYPEDRKALWDWWSA